MVPLDLGNAVICGDPVTNTLALGPVGGLQFLVANSAVPNSLESTFRGDFTGRNAETEPGTHAQLGSVRLEYLSDPGLGTETPSSQAA